MLSVADIQKVEFTKGFRGYETGEVDEFIDACAATVQALTEERDTLNKKLAVLADKLLEYRNQEDSIRSALLSAQRLGDSTLREANQKADLILEDAKIKAEKILQEAEKKAAAIAAQAEEDIQHEKRALEQLQREVADFKNRMLSIYKEHLSLIQALPEPEPTEPEQPVEGRSEELATSGAQEESAKQPAEQPAEEIPAQENPPKAPNTQNNKKPVPLADSPTEEFMAINLDPPQEDEDTDEPAIPLGGIAQRPAEDREPALAGQVTSKFQDLQFGDDYDFGLNSKKRRKK